MDEQREGGPAGPSRPLLHEVAALERTALAWERTAVASAAVGTMLLKVVDGGWLTEATGLVLVVAAVVIVLVMVPLGYRRARARVDAATPAAPFVAPDRWRPVALALTSALVCLTVVAVSVDMGVLYAR